MNNRNYFIYDYEKYLLNLCQELGNNLDIIYFL
jgi:hypothetical protein